MKVVLLAPTLIDGQRYEVGEQATVDNETGQRLIAHDEAFEDRDLRLERVLDQAERLLAQEAEAPDSQG